MECSATLRGHSTDVYSVQFHPLGVRFPYLKDIRDMLSAEVMTGSRDCLI